MELADWMVVLAIWIGVSLVSVLALWGRSNAEDAAWRAGYDEGYSDAQNCVSG